MPITIKIDITRAKSSALKSGLIIVSPERMRMSGMHLRRAIIITATAMRLQAVRLPVRGISLKAMIAATNCRRIESIRMNATVIPVSSSSSPYGI